MAARPPISLWLTLGFAAGLAFGWFAFRDAKSPAAQRPAAAKAAKPPEPASEEIPVNAGTLRAVEQTFERWGGYAVWENDTTEIAVWDPRRKKHSDTYEVRRHEGRFYFRALRALTRPLIDHGVSATMPVQFTEPPEARARFYREHPDYDPATAPRVDLPPLPPERSAGGSTGMSSNAGSITSGAGG